MIQATPSSLTVSPEVQAFAAEEGVSAYLPAVLSLVQQLFAEARRMAVFVEEDPEIANDRHIVIEVDVVGWDSARFRAAESDWIEESGRICPAPLVCVFRLGLEHVEP
jgi:hypothetical protein